MPSFKIDEYSSYFLLDFTLQISVVKLLSCIPYISGNTANAEDKFTFSEQYYWLNTDEALDDALRQGIPSAILNVVEHFSFQKPSSIWPFSRRYFIIGHFTSYMLW